MVSSSPPDLQPHRPPSGTGARRNGNSRQPPPPRWLMAVLSLCLTVIVIALATRPLWPGDKPGPVAEAAAGEEENTPTLPPAVMLTLPPEPTPTLSFTPTPEPSPVLEPSAPPVQKENADGSSRGDLASGQPVAPVGSGSWFSDAVFIGDSRVAGLRLYSGITADATFLDHTGLTVYEVKEGKKVIRRGDQKISVLDALAGGTYGKVYIALGVNELGYFNPDGFAETCGEVVEAIREELPEARIYIQSLIPVNTEKCKANDIPYYITNEGIAGYNEALSAYFADKSVYLLGIPDGLVEANGEIYKDYSADGVHFKKDGYVLWLNYLSAHTEG